MDDLIISREGNLEAVIVTPDVGYGATGPYAYPYYGYDYGFDPAADVYELPYARTDIAEWEPFDYGEMDEEIFD